MTATVKPLPFEPDRFRSAAAFYEKGRVPYAATLIRRIADVTGLGSNDRILDLGCGPGPLSRAFAPLVGEIVAMDPSSDMLSSGRALAADRPNIRFVQGSSYDLDLSLGRFRLVVMGRSFHWMDRVDTLRRLDGMIEPDGAVALFHDSAPPIPVNAWQKNWREIRERYEPASDLSRRGSDWVRHEAVLLDSAFSRLETFGVIERKPVDVETLIERALSMSTTSPSKLGEKSEAMVAELRAALADVHEEVVQTSALVGWRP